MFLRYKLLWMMVLLNGWSHFSTGEVVDRLTMADVARAREELLTSAKNNKFMKKALIATVATVISAGAILLIKAMPAWSEFKDYQTDRRILNTVDRGTMQDTIDAVFNVTKGQAVAFRPVHLRQVMLVQERAIRNCIASETVKNQTWGNQLIGLARAGCGLVATVMAPQILAPVVNKYNDVFGRRDFTWLVGRHLGMAQQYTILKQTQIVWDPTAYLSQGASPKDADMSAMAQLYQMNYAKMLLSDRQSAQQIGKEACIAQINHIIHQTGYIIADIQLRACDSKQADMLEQLAEQLYQITFELALQLEPLVVQNQTSELFKELRLFQAACSATVNSVVLLLNN